MRNTLSWSVMMLAACGVAANALFAALAPGLRSSFVEDIIQTSGSAALLHFLGGTVVVIVGALQFNSRLRTSHLNLHRWLGRVYVCGVLFGGLAGLYLAFYSVGGVVAHFGFGMMAVCWLYTTGMAFGHIRARRIHQHQDWMIRSYAVTLGAVTLRLYIPLFLIAGVPFEEAYPVIAWLCWVPNILIAEWLIIAPRRLRPPLSGYES